MLLQANKNLVPEQKNQVEEAADVETEDSAATRNLFEPSTQQSSQIPH